MGGSKKEQITCILCKQLKGPSREHVLQRALGGNLVARNTCEDCNNRTSSIDQALAEHSIVALSRVSNTPKDAFHVSLKGDIFGHDPGTGLTVDMSLCNLMRAEILPQIHFLSEVEGDTREAQIMAKDLSDHRRLDAFIRKQIRTRKLRSTFVKEGPEAAGSTTRFVLYRKNQAYVRVPPGGREDAARILETIERDWDRVSVFDQLKEGIKPREIEKPKVRIGMSICKDDEYRSVAKIAFNLMAVEFGTEFALRAEFDDIRSYILGDDIQHPKRLEENQVAVDDRFVRQHAEQDLYLATAEHVVVLAPSGGSLFAWVTLYGMHQYAVRLGDASVGDFVMSVFEFSTTRDGYRKLDVREIYDRIIQARRAQIPKRRNDKAFVP